MKVLIGFPKMGVEIPSTTQSHLLWAIAICYIVRNGRAGVPPKQERSWPGGRIPTETETNVKKRIKTNKIETTLDISDYDGFGPLHPAFGV